MYWIIEWICFLVGTYHLLQLVRFLHSVILTLRSKQNPSVYGKGAWALITGATDGIGKGFARELARNGFNIILVSRTAQKLRDTAQELQAEFKVDTQEVEADFGKCTINPINFFTAIHDQVKDKDIAVLVNNVGTAKPGFLCDLSVDALLQTNALNLWPIAMLSRLIIPSMLKRPQKGLIMNLGSVASTMPGPGGAAYCAGKAFDLHLSNIMGMELSMEEKQNAGIDVMCLKPGYVDTPLTKNVEGKTGEISADECVRCALRIAGALPFTNGHWKHILMETAIPYLVAIMLLTNSVPRPKVD